MKAIGNTLASLAMASLLFHGTDAMAQFRGGFPRGGARAPAPQRPAPEETRVNQPEELAEELRQDLHLRPEQRPAWDYYLEKVRAISSDIARQNMRSRARPAATALQRIDQSVDVARDRLTALEEVAAAARKLYAVLEPEQQSVADARLAAIIPQLGEVVPPRGAAGRLHPEAR